MMSHDMFSHMKLSWLQTAITRMPATIEDDKLSTHWLRKVRYSSLFRISSFHSSPFEAHPDRVLNSRSFGVSLTHFRPISLLNLPKSFIISMESHSFHTQFLIHVYFIYITFMLKSHSFYQSVVESSAQGLLHCYFHYSALILQFHFFHTMQPCPPPSLDLTLVSDHKFFSSQCHLVSSSNHMIILTKSYTSEHAQSCKIL